MHGDKRLWIYAGLAVPEGIGLVKLPVMAAPRARRVLLVGDDRGRPLVPVLRRLAADSGARLQSDLRRGSTPRQWLSSGRLVAQLARFRPGAVLVALDPRDVVARRSLHEQVRRAGALDVWLVPPGLLRRSQGRFVAAQAADARSLAAWAARAWQAAWGRR